MTERLLVGADLRAARESGVQAVNWPARRSGPSAPESAHQQRGASPRRTEHWLSVAEGDCWNI